MLEVTMKADLQCKNTRRNNINKWKTPRGIAKRVSILQKNRKKSEQMGTNRGIPENKESKSEQIGRNCGEIGTNRGDPFLVTPN